MIILLFYNKSNMANFIKAALDKVLTEGNQFPSVTYETLPAVVKYMEMQSAIGESWVEKKEKVINILYIYVFFKSK